MTHRLPPKGTHRLTSRDIVDDLHVPRDLRGFGPISEGLLPLDGVKPLNTSGDYAYPTQPLSDAIGKRRLYTFSTNLPAYRPLSSKVHRQLRGDVDLPRPIDLSRAGAGALRKLWQSNLSDHPRFGGFMRKHYPAHSGDPTIAHFNHFRAYLLQHLRPAKRGTLGKLDSVSPISDAYIIPAEKLDPKHLFTVKTDQRLIAVNRDGHPTTISRNGEPGVTQAIINYHRSGCPEVPNPATQGHFSKVPDRFIRERATPRSLLASYGATPGLVGPEIRFPKRRIHGRLLRADHLTARV